MRALPALTIMVAAAVLTAGLAILVLDPPAQASTLSKFSSDDELRLFLQQHASQNSGAKDATGYATAEAATYSGTNNQVAGVEEGDMVKNDGSTIFIAKGNVVHVIGTNPSLSNITTITLGSDQGNNYTYINGIYLWEDQLVVLYTVYEYVNLNPYPLKDGVAAMYYPYWSTQSTCVRVYDIHDPSDPETTFSAGVSGYLLTSRMIDSTLYVVADQNVWLGSNITMPTVSSNGDEEGVGATSISYDPSCPEVSFFINLLAFDVSSGETASLTTLAGPASLVYMSGTALYIAMQHWKYSSSWISTSSVSSVTTQIFRVAVDGISLALTAQGEVDGVILNQFAIDERGDRLRVATTTYSAQTVSSVHVFDLDLKEVGTLTGIAPGEQIYSSRFLGDRLYLVTFRQVDPLFVIDLSTDVPQMMGQLKIPGVSTYLQMIPEGLLGIGFQNGSVKISLFNVTDPQGPFEVGTFTEQGMYSYSTAQYDHHAVLYDERNGLLVIPLTYYAETMEKGWAYFQPISVALVLGIENTGFTEIGRIWHANATVERALYINDILYTVSDTTIKASSLTDLTLIDELVYSESQPYRGWYGIAEPMVK